MDEASLVREFNAALPDNYVCLSPVLRRFLGGLCSQPGDTHGPRTTACAACNASICTNHRFRVHNDCPLCPDVFVCAAHRATYRLETFACAIIGCRVRRTWCSTHEAMGVCMRQVHMCTFHTNSFARECAKCNAVHHSVHRTTCACMGTEWSAELCPHHVFTQPVECPPHWTHTQPPGRILTSRVIRD